mmetsp:Transcript_62070/g.140401  ORF Transcript_62070/g.140401 Transcript_62070/m.140401 type:complete len:175 (-) Transcript_62070:13-537(-)
MLVKFPKAQFVITTLGSKGSVVSARRTADLEQGREGTFKSHLPLAGAAVLPGCPVSFERAETKHQELDYGGCDLLRATAWPLPTGAAVVDTTGAGDSFIGGVLYALRFGYTLDAALAAGSYVACQKIQDQGARRNLPSSLPTCVFPRGLRSAVPLALGSSGFTGMGHMCQKPTK